MFCTTDLADRTAASMLGARIGRNSTGSSLSLRPTKTIMKSIAAPLAKAPKRRID
jgi:hypothetical protein